MMGPPSGSRLITTFEVFLDVERPMACFSYFLSPISLPLYPQTSRMSIVYILYALVRRVDYSVGCSPMYTVMQLKI